MTEDDVPMTRIPSDFHHKSWEEISEEERQDPAVKTVLGIVHMGENLSRRLYATHHNVMADTTYTQDANANRSSEFAKRELAKFDKSFHPTIRDIEGRVTALEAQMNRAPKMPSESLAEKIALRLYALPPEERIKVVGDAMKKGKTDTIGAALFFSDAWLTGLSEERRELFRAQYREMVYPEQVKQHAYLKAHLERLVRGRNVLGADVERRYNLKEIEESQKRADRARKSLE